MKLALGIVACFALGGAAYAEPAKEYKALDVDGLKALVEHGGLVIYAEEYGGHIQVMDGKSWPGRLSLAGCDADGACHMVRAYTRYVVGESEPGRGAVNRFIVERPDSKVAILLSGGGPAAEVGRDIELAHGRTEDEIIGEIRTAIGAGADLRKALRAADPGLETMLRERG